MNSVFSVLFVLGLRFGSHGHGAGRGLTGTFFRLISTSVLGNYDVYCNAKLITHTHTHPHTTHTQTFRRSLMWSFNKKINKICKQSC